MSNVFTLIALAPVSFHEEIGDRPTRFRLQGAAYGPAMVEWLVGAANVALDSAVNLSIIAEATLSLGDDDATLEVVAEAELYLRIYDAVHALLTRNISG